MFKFLTRNKKQTLPKTIPPVILSQSPIMTSGNVTINGGASGGGGSGGAGKYSGNGMLTGTITYGGSTVTINSHPCKIEYFYNQKRLHDLENFLNENYKFNQELLNTIRQILCDFCEKTGNLAEELKFPKTFHKDGLFEIIGDDVKYIAQIYWQLLNNDIYQYSIKSDT